MNTDRENESAPIAGPRWFGVVLWCAAVGSSVAWLYVLSTSRGWLPGVAGPTHSLFMMGSSVAIIWSMLALLKEEVVVSLTLLMLAIPLLIMGMVFFVQSY